MTGILAYQSATAGTTSAILFENINIENMWCGLVGVQGGGNVENCILKNVGFNGCGMYGMKLTGQNVLNWQVYGGGASSCGWLSTIVPGVGGAPENYGGGYAVGSGSCGCFYGLSCTANQWDVIHTGQQCHVAGGSFEGQQNYNGNLTWSSGTATLATDVPHKMTFTQGIAIFAAIDNNGAGVNVPGWEGRFTGTIVDATHISYPLAASPGGTGIIRAGVSSLNAGNFACVGTTMSISGCSYRCGDSLRGLWVYNEGGMVVMDGCLMDPGHNSGNKGSIIAHVSNGYLQMNGSIFSHLEDSSFKSAGVSELFLRQTQWIGAPTTVNSPFTQFSGGRIREYDRVYETTVGNLPTASAIFTSLRGFVTDANATTFGTTVAAGGSNKVPVFCDGTNWKIG
jgi:hypothetical protein